MYFNSHPRIIYNDVEVVNIFTKIIPIKKLLENAIAWELYDLEDGESPELLSYRLYGSVKYHWVLMMINDVIDINKDWPLSTQNFGDFVDSKYDEPNAIHHWEDEDGDEDEDVLSSPTAPASPVKGDYWWDPAEEILYLRLDSNWLDVTEVEAAPYLIKNINYEEELQKKKALIKVLKPEYLDPFVEEFKSLL